MPEKAIAVNLEKECAFYKSEYERIKTEYKEQQEKLHQVWNDADKMFSENQRLKHDMESLKRTLQILIGGADNA